MTAHFLATFLQDVKKLRDNKVRRQVVEAIVNVEHATSLSQIRSLKRLSGHPDYYRVRIGHWRIGLIVRGNVVTFVRCLHRREIYRYFP